MDSKVFDISLPIEAKSILERMEDDVYTSLLSFDQSIQNIALDEEHLLDQSTDIPQIDSDADITHTRMAAVQYALQRKMNPNKETGPLR